VGFFTCPDYRDTVSLSRLFSGCDVVVHLAARAHQTSEDDSAATLELYRAANVASLVSVSQAARSSGVRRVLFVSSIGVNGSSTKGTPFTEADLPAPSEPYALSKLEAEQALAVQLADGSTDWVILRPPLVYGPGCPGNLQRLIRLASSAPLLPFGALHARRTMISIDNLLDSLLIAAFHPAVSRSTFVVADSQSIDVSGMLAALLQGLRRGLWRLIPVPPCLIGFLLHILGKQALWKKFSSELLVDSSAFCKATGWVPSVGPHDGLRTAAAAAVGALDV
jgi:nucleoside-diphosphate-sugar epimerase